MTVKLQLITSSILIITALLENFASADDSDIINPNWVKPGWRGYRDRHAKVPTKEENCQCPVVSECSAESPKQSDEPNSLAFMLYKKFLIRLFDESKLELDEENAYYKVRNVQFKVTDLQLRRIKEAQTARDIDAVVISIVEQSSASVYHSMAETLCWNIVAWYGSAMQSSIFLYVIIPACLILVVLSIGRFLGMRLWVLVPTLGILITYVLTYRDCNNQLQLEALTTLLKTDGSNPCGKHHRSGWLNRLLQKDNEADCIEHLREQYGLKRSFCDPSEVFIQMVAKMHLQYFEAFVLKMVSIFKVSTASSGLVETLLISGFIIFLVYLLMTVGIKYGLYASGRFLADIVTRPRMREQGSVQDAPQGPAQILPPAPFKINININRPRRTNSRVEANSNRIEEIMEGDSDSRVAIASIEEPSRRKEDGSGDRLAGKDEATDESEPSDEETYMILCDLEGDVPKDTTKNVTNEQTKASVE